MRGMTQHGRPSDALDAVATLHEPTRRRLYELVSGRDEPVSRDEAAEALGIGRPIAAFHLDRLARAGLLTTSHQRLTGRSGPGAGRPSKLYRRAAGAVEVSVPARSYEVAAALFADALEQPGQAEQLTERARARGRAIGLEVGSALGDQPSPEDREGAVIAALGRAGYEPRVDGATILLRNCPFDGLVQEHRQLTCGMNLAILEGIRDGLGDTTRAPRPVTIPGYCCVAFVPEEPGSPAA